MSDSSFVQGSGLVFIGKILSMGLGFLGNIIIARLFGQVALGELTIALLILNTLAMVSLFGLPQGLVRFLPRTDDRSEQKRIVSAVSLIAFPTSLLISSLLFVFAEVVAQVLFDSPAGPHIIRLFAVAIPIQTARKLSIGTIRGFQDSTSKVFINDIFNPIVKFLLLIIAIAAGGQLLAIAGAYVATFCIVCIVLIWRVYDRHSMDIKVVSPFKYHKIIYYSTPLLLVSIMTFSFTYVDRFLLAYFGTTGEVGVYTAMYDLVQTITLSLVGFNYLFFPSFSELHSNEQNDKMNDMYHFVTRGSVILALPIVMIYLLYPTLIIRYTFGRTFIEGQLVLILLSIGVFSHVISGLNRSAIKAIGDTKRATIGTGIAFVLNIILNILLIPQFSMVGAAIATMASYFIWNFYYLFVLYSSTTIKPIENRILVFLATVIIIHMVVWKAISIITSTPIQSLVLFICISTIIYPFLIYKIGLVTRSNIDNAIIELKSISGER